MQRPIPSERNHPRVVKMPMSPAHVLAMASARGRVRAVPQRAHRDDEQQRGEELRLDLRRRVREDGVEERDERRRDQRDARRDVEVTQEEVELRHDRGGDERDQDHDAEPAADREERHRDDGQS